MPWIHGANFLAPEFPFGFRFQRLELNPKEQDGIHPSLFPPQEISKEKKMPVKEWILFDVEELG